jgi:SAM-dependent methyltransferase
MLKHHILSLKYVHYPRWANKQFIRKEAKKMMISSDVLDVGAGRAPYKQYFEEHNYMTQDIKDYEGNIDVISNIYNIPLMDKSQDFIICTQVMEHLNNPDEAFKEFNRLLRIGGKVLLTVPLMTGEHEKPNDYYRYTQYALKELGERNGFKIMMIRAQGGLFITIDFLLWEAVGKVTGDFIRYTLLLPFKMVTGVISFLLDELDKEKEFTMNYAVVYKKVK